MSPQTCHWQRRMYRVVDCLLDFQIADLARMEYVAVSLLELNSIPSMELSLYFHSMNLYNTAEKYACIRLNLPVFHKNKPYSYNLQYHIYY